MPTLLAGIDGDPQKTQIKQGTGNEITDEAQKGNPEGNATVRHRPDVEAEDHLPRRPAGYGDKVGKIQDRNHDDGQEVEQGKPGHRLGDPGARRGGRPGASPSGRLAEEMGQSAGQQKDEIDDVQYDLIDAKGKAPPPETSVSFSHGPAPFGASPPPRRPPAGPAPQISPARTG